MTQLGFYFNQTRCIGCYTCAVACKDWHDHQAGSVNWMQIKTVEKGTFPKLFLAFAALPCHQCESPACMAVCPVEAISKRESDGIVVVDQERCLGREKCKKAPCLKACLSRSPQFGPEDNAKMQKCDFCLERLNWMRASEPQATSNELFHNFVCSAINALDPGVDKIP